MSLLTIALLFTAILMHFTMCINNLKYLSIRGYYFTLLFFPNEENCILSQPKQQIFCLIITILLCLTTN